MPNSDTLTDGNSDTDGDRNDGNHVERSSFTTGGSRDSSQGDTQGSQSSDAESAIWWTASHGGQQPPDPDVNRCNDDGGQPAEPADINGGQPRVAKPAGIDGGQLGVAEPADIDGGQPRMASRHC